MTRAAILSLALLLAPAPLAAAGEAQQPQQPRRLEVPATAAWQHAATEMILPARSAGLERGEISDLGDDEMDVVAQYRGGEGVVATVYLFRTSVPDVALWFDRAATAIASSPQYGSPAAALAAPSPFARPGAPAPSGLRLALDLGAGELRSTALAVAPLGAHLLKIRISSTRLDSAGIDALLTRFIEGLRWPAVAKAERAAAPIQPCPEPLRLRNARVVRATMGDALMDALTGIAVESAATEQAPAFCREPGATQQYGVYRPGASREAYLIALNDAGIALSVGQAIDLAELSGGRRGRRRISMTLLGRNMTSVLPSFDRLPPPAQAVAVAFSGRGPGISVTTSEPRD